MIRWRSGWWRTRWIRRTHSRSSDVRAEVGLDLLGALVFDVERQERNSSGEQRADGPTGRYTAP